MAFLSGKLRGGGGGPNILTVTKFDLDASGDATLDLGPSALNKMAFVTVADVEYLGYPSIGTVQVNGTSLTPIGAQFQVYGGSYGSAFRAYYGRVSGSGNVTLNTPNAYGDAIAIVCSNVISDTAYATLRDTEVDNLATTVGIAAPFSGIIMVAGTSWWSDYGAAFGSWRRSTTVGGSGTVYTPDGEMAHHYTQNYRTNHWMSVTKCPAYAQSGAVDGWYDLGFVGSSWDYPSSRNGDNHYFVMSIK